MEATKPYEFIGFGAMEVTKPHEFIRFGAKWNLEGHGENTVLTASVRAALHDYLTTKLGFTPKGGAAPKGELERIVQRHLARFRR